jgi:hypothetical protein
MRVHMPETVICECTASPAVEAEAVAFTRGRSADQSEAQAAADPSEPVAALERDPAVLC